MLHLLTANYDIEHTRTTTSDSIRVFATIFPQVCFAKQARHLADMSKQDDLLLSFTRRQARA